MGDSVARKCNHIDCIWIFTDAATIIVQIINFLKKFFAVVDLFYLLLFSFFYNYLSVFFDYYLIILQLIFEKLLILVNIIVWLVNLFHTIAL